MGIKAQAAILLRSLQRDNLLKWGMDLKSKWVDLKPLGHHPPASVCAIASTPTVIDGPCHCLIMVWLFFPGTEKLPYPQAEELCCWCGGRMCPEMWRLMLTDYIVTVQTTTTEIPDWFISQVACLTFLSFSVICALLQTCVSVSHHILSTIMLSENDSILHFNVASRLQQTDVLTLLKRKLLSHLIYSIVHKRYIQ